jgi:hypothetical protein
MSARNGQRFDRTCIGGFAATALALLLASPAVAAGPQLAAKLTATTANMTPAGKQLRLQILEWPSEDARAEAIASLAAGAEAATPLAKLPTVGYVWPAESPVGYSVKYAHRVPDSNGGERITLVTDKRLGSYEFRGWSVDGGAASSAPYSVIELYLPASGNGTGNLSLKSEVVIDEAAGTVTLKDGAGTAPLLTDVRLDTAP